MTNLICLERRDPVSPRRMMYINPKHVVAVISHAERVTKIITTNGENFLVTGEINAIAMLLRHTKVETKSVGGQTIYESNSHTPECQENHSHVAPNCCSEDCWCYGL